MYIPYKIQLLKWKLFRKSEGEKILRRSYEELHHRPLNTEHPNTFSEKLFCRMINVNRHGNNRFTQLADKYLVRKYVEDKIGKEYLVNLLWSGCNVEEIPFETLPRKCVLKTNHGSGQIVVLTDDIDRKEIKARLRKWLSQNYYWAAGEYHYYDIPRRILVEEFLDGPDVDVPLDYRFWCFNGYPEIIQVDNHLHDINPFYDSGWNKLEVSYRRKFRDVDIPIPENFQQMLSVVKTLSSDLDFVRVDLYNVSGKIYFGELTFTPVAGRFVFTPNEWDVYLGHKWGVLQSLIPRIIETGSAFQR